MIISQIFRRACQLHEDRLATLQGTRRQSYGQLGSRVRRLAAALASLDVRRGDRVAILAQNSDRYIEYFFAVAWAGAIMVPLNIRWSVSEIAYGLNDSGSTVLFVDGAYAPIVGELLARVDHPLQIIALDEKAGGEGRLDFESLVAGHAEQAEAGARTEDDVCGIFYTGGTTGRAKGVMLTDRNILTNAFHALLEFGYYPGAVYLHSAPMFHAADCASTFALTLCGAVHAVVPAFEPKAVLRAIEDHRVNFALFVPTMLMMLLDEAQIDAHDLSSLERIIYGASPMPEALLRRAMARFPDCRFVQGYGMTELSPLATVLEPRWHQPDGPHPERLRSAGRATFGVDVRIVGPSGEELPRGEVGEIVCRGANVMKGYWNKPEETDGCLIDGWMHTGDGGYMDADGFIYLVDRIKDMIITGGENVYSAEVEEAIYRYPGIAQCAVIGVPHPKWGESVHAIVVPRPGAEVTADEITAHCRGVMAAFKVPRSVEIRRDPLPLSGAGKILKAELRNGYRQE